MKTFIILFLIMMCSSLLAKDFNLKFYQAFLKEDIPAWELLLKEMEKDYADHATDSLMRDIVKARFGLLYLYNSIAEEDKAEDELDVLKDQLEDLLDRHPDDACLWANRTAMIGMCISSKPYKVMFYGPLSLEYIEKARALNKHLPEVMIEYGNIKFNAPSFAGGDKELGIRLYQDAIAKMVAHQDAYKNDWFFLMAHLNYAYMLREMGQKEVALHLYEWLLRYEPDYGKLSHKLIPEVKKELDKS